MLIRFFRHTVLLSFLAFVGACSDGTNSQSSNGLSLGAANAEVPTGNASESTPIIAGSSVSGQTNAPSNLPIVQPASTSISEAQELNSSQVEIGSTSQANNTTPAESAEINTIQPASSSSSETQESISSTAEFSPTSPANNTSAVESASVDASVTEETNTTIQTNAAASGSSYPAFDKLSVFPKAEGFGTNSTAGRGGNLCIVTSLNDSGPGTLRNCAESSGPRIVIFKTGGTIEVSSSIKITNPFISIYGQTAPGDGILLRASQDSDSAPLAIKTHDVLVQHLRIRAGSSNLITCCRDAVQIGNSSPGQTYNVVLDHNSISWGTDEIVDIWHDTHDVTLSYNIVSESLHDNGSNSSGPGGRGILVGSNGAHSISLHHNYIAHSYERNPLIATSGIVDVNNNLIYHWLSRGAEHDTRFDGQKVNWIKNKYIALDNPTENQSSQVAWGDLLITLRSSFETNVYFEGNIGKNRPDNTFPEWSIANTDWNTPYDPTLNYHSDTRFPAPPVTEFEADSLENILPEIVGATAPRRDSVDNRLISQYKSGTGLMPNCVSANDRPGDERCALNVGGWPTMNSGVAPEDSDNDGIPDLWEISHGLNPNVEDSLEDANGDGFLNIEDWAYEMAN